MGAMIRHLLPAVPWALVGLLSWPALAVQAAELTAAPTQPACDIEAEFEPRYDSQPRVLAVTLRFDADGRDQTLLRSTPSWAGIADFAAAWHGFEGGSPAVQIEPAPAAGTALRWQVRHPSQGRVELRYRVRAALADPDDGRPQPQEWLYRPQLGADWFQFFGHGVLPSLEPWGDDRSARLCVTLRQPGAPQAPAFGSHHAGQGEQVSAVVTGSPSLLRHAFYAGGMGWRVQQRPVAGAQLHTAVRGRFETADEAFAEASARLIDGHRRFWGSDGAPPPWLVLTPNFQRRNFGGTLVHRAAVLHAGPDFSAASRGFEFLIGHEHLHEWFPQRFGSTDPDPVRAVHGYWFSEGFTNLYTHRLLLDSGLWTLQRYADELTEVLRGYWRSPAREAPVASLAPRFFSDRDAGRQLYARGEILGLRWDAALREQGHAGLDEVLRGLRLPPGPRALDGPRATERVLQALQPWLGERPRREVEQHVEQGHILALEADLAGPCFVLQWGELPRWVLGFDPASFKSRQLSGVLPSGPAWAAGARDGQALQAWSVFSGDTDKEVELTVADAPGAAGRVLRYHPVDGSVERLPRLVVQPGAESAAACRAWRQRSGDRRVAQPGE